MILSYNWLKELTGTKLEAGRLGEELTRAGLNVESVTPVGEDFALDADITTNRPDWLCHLGVAYEVAALGKGAVKRPVIEIRESGPDVNSLTSVAVMPDAAACCPRYTARVIRGVRVAPSPAWLRDRLTAIGQRSINNVVDVTNLVCFEMNQPLHAFDMDKLAEGRIVLRMAGDGERFDAITGESCVLDRAMLVIADAEKAVALAGVKGGANTEVGAGTTNVFLESAWFQPRSTRYAARRTRTSSESSYRYERGIDPGMTEEASRRAAALIVQLAGGELAAGVIDTNPGLAKSWTVRLRHARCEKVLGFAVPPRETEEILNGLGLSTVERDAGSITVRVPTFRQDLKREIDLIEEVVRLAGYDRVPDRVTMPLALAHVRPEEAAVRRIRRALTGLGYNECSTDSFVPAEWCGPEAGAGAYRVQNPVNAERPMLRTSLLPSLMEARRVNRAEARACLFEIGRTYHKTDSGPRERSRLAVLDDRGADYARGAIEAAVAAVGAEGEVSVEPVDALPGCRAGTGARLRLDGKPLAAFGVASDEMTGSLDLDSAPALGEMDIAVLAEAEKRARFYKPLPRFPGVRRDISLAVAEEVKWAEVETAAREAASMLDSLAFESLYRGKGMQPGRKALAFSMILRAPDRSLTDAEANAVRDRVAAALLAAFPGAELR